MHIIDDAIALLNSLYESGDLSVDQHAGIMRGIETLQQEVAELRASAELATTRWKRSEAVRRAAIDSACELGLLIEKHESYTSTLRAAIVEIRQVSGDDIRAICDRVLDPS